MPAPFYPPAPTPPALQAVFPVVMRILPTCVFNKKDPIVVGVDIVEGIAKIGTPVAAITETGAVELGRIAGMEINHKVRIRARAVSDKVGRRQMLQNSVVLPW